MKNIELVEKLKNKNLHISFAESITGGELAKLITDVSGASNIINMSFVTYSNEAKMQILKVKKSTIENFGVVSAECAKEMAEGLKKISNADICVSTTGNAGPSVLENKPVGRVYVGIFINDEYFPMELNLKGERNEIRNEVCDIIFDYILQFVK